MVLLHTKEAKSFKQTPEAREEAWNTFFPIALKRNHLCQPLDLGLVAADTMRQQISVIQALSLWYFITAALMYKEWSKDPHGRNCSTKKEKKQKIEDLMLL